MKKQGILWLLAVLLCWIVIDTVTDRNLLHKPVTIVTDTANCWTGAGINQIPVDEEGEQIRYGHDLIANTAVYLGPKGSVSRSTNGMNCQNCHLEAGTKPWGNNYGAVAATYPKYRDRSGQIESIEKRVNDCLERSLNGKALDSMSKEMRAIVSYIRWLGKEVPRGTKPKGSGIMDLPKMKRAADPLKGEQVYQLQCSRCHGNNGSGQLNTDGKSYTYPPLWGEHSFNTGAGLYRLSRLAGYVRNNMPNPTSYHAPVLTSEEAWDVAAFINSQPRPVWDTRNDWRDIRKKPFDHPFGPYADSSNEVQHKYGPWPSRTK